MLIGKKWTFSASHHLPDHRGKCRGSHGHNYTVEIMLDGPVFREEGESENGMVMDYGVMNTLWKDEIELICDHKDLNIVLNHELFEITTAENLACWIYGRVYERLGKMFSAHAANSRPWLACVTVSETDNTYARAGATDWEEFTKWQSMMRDKFLGPTTDRDYPSIVYEKSPIAP